jgi:hypothetical protein
MTQGGNLSIGALTGPFNLNLNAGSGTLNLQGDIGQQNNTSATPTSAQLTGATINANGNIYVNTILAFNGNADVNASNIIALGGVAFNGATTLNNALTINTTNNQISFNGTLDGAQSLTMNAGSSGSINFNGAVGSQSPLAAIQIINANNVTSNVVMNVSSFTQNAGTGTTSFNGTGKQGAVSLITNNVAGTYNVITLALGVNSGNIQATVNGATGSTAANAVLLLKPIVVGTLFINGVNIGLPINNVVPSFTNFITGTNPIGAGLMSITASLGGPTVGGSGPLGSIGTAGSGGSNSGSTTLEDLFSTQGPSQDVTVSPPDDNISGNSKDKKADSKDKKADSKEQSVQ